ncbi:cupin domain-containing protein [Roseixanthobacter liquoris]|uniref:hypothetical protein n=1 Tax=Roseixanthobacter liquoris TaxID=3119921 RepID=UPI00372C9B16
MTVSSRAKWAEDARYFEYTKVANPIGHQTPKCPLGSFDRQLHQGGETRIIPLDLSAGLMCPSPATSPNLSANFIRINAGESITTSINATSELYFVIEGKGQTQIGGDALPWEQHDLFTLPLGAATHVATTDSVLYWVHDQPLLTYLGVRAETPRFRPTLFRHEDEDSNLSAIRNDPHAKDRNRVSVLLANSQCAMTETATHVLWAMYGVLPAGATQLPHRHQSVALDLIIHCKPGCYSLLGEELDADGNIINPVRADWNTASAFVTPPGWWHAHYNETDEDAFLLPIQDAGLQTFMRTLDIHFFHKDHQSFISLKK